MTDQQRGAYTPPTDAPLAFEARQPVRGARPFPVTLVVSVLVLIGLAGAIFVFYRSGVRQAAQAPQAVGAPVGPLKEAAPADAQPQDAAQGLQIYRSEAGQPPQPVTAQPQFAPPPEQPQARAPSASPTPPPAAAPTTPIASAPAPALRPAQEAPAAPPKPVALAEAKPPAKPAPPAPKPAAEKPAAKSAPAAAKKPETADRIGDVLAAKSGAAAVQIGAVASPQLADRTWNEAVAAAPGLAAGKGKGVEKVEKDGKTLYRTSVTGFASRAQAQAFCGKLKATGKACFVK